MITAIELVARPVNKSFVAGIGSGSGPSVTGGRAQFCRKPIRGAVALRRVDPDFTFHQLD